jgi:hypothetical protein
MSTKDHGNHAATPAKPAKPQAKPGVERASLPGERAEAEGMIAPTAGKTGTQAPAHTGKAKAEGVEGEGSYSATHRYDAGVAKSVAKGNTEELAEKAAKALDGPEGAELRRAEEAAKHGHR